MNTFTAGMGLPEGIQEQFFSEVDSAHDGVIWFSEFWAFFRRLCEAPEAPAPDLEEEEAAPAAAAAAATQAGAAPKSEWV